MFPPRRAAAPGPAPAGPALPMSDVLAVAAGSRFEPPTAGAPGGFGGAELSSGTCRTAAGGGRRGDAAWAAVGLRGAGGRRGARGSSFERCLRASCPRAFPMESDFFPCLLIVRK